MKKKLLRAIIYLTVLISLPIWALLPPKYLSVRDWQRCVITITKGDAKFICLPDSKPKECPKSSWRKLTFRNEVNSCKLK